MPPPNYRRGATGSMPGSLERLREDAARAEGRNVQRARIEDGYEPTGRSASPEDMAAFEQLRAELAAEAMRNEQGGGQFKRKQPPPDARRYPELAGQPNRLPRDMEQYPDPEYDQLYERGDGGQEMISAFPNPGSEGYRVGVNPSGADDLMPGYPTSEEADFDEGYQAVVETRPGADFSYDDYDNESHGEYWKNHPEHGDVYEPGNERMSQAILDPDKNAKIELLRAALDAVLRTPTPKGKPAPAPAPASRTSGRKRGE